MTIAMKLAAAAAAALLLAQGAASAGPRTVGDKADPNKKKICRAETDIGTRLGGKSVCRTAAEWAQVRAEARRVVERIQDDKPTLCAPGRPC
ncbi:MAG: hypothetical protein JOZ90_12930 [Alphaproteobacteria bacterium]|nr:hypothetical protein [Alphaproteobacteria bacterium]MBV9370366.1 hypothetical protein [Alphaproteobacteria bacterium]MBV9901977.1 hypothetical protein [Alphaproteobacteria bacterium]